MSKGISKIMQQKNKVCLKCECMVEKELYYYCTKKKWPIPFAEERSALGNRPCWCPLNEEINIGGNNEVNVIPIK